MYYCIFIVSVNPVHVTVLLGWIQLPEASWLQSHRVVWGKVHVCVYMDVCLCVHVGVYVVQVLRRQELVEWKLSMGLKKGLVGILSKMQLNIRDHAAVLFMPSALQTSPGTKQEALSLDASGQSGS